MAMYLSMPWFQTSLIVPRGGNARRLPRSAFLSPRMWVSSMAWKRGTLRSHTSGAGSWRSRGDLVGVIADPVVEVVLTELGPERLQLVLGHPGPGAGVGSFSRIEATAPPRQWPGQREMSWF